MRIERVELMPCVLRKDDPKWRFALGANPTTEGVIVTLIGEDGERGYGYASATPHMGATRERLGRRSNASCRWSKGATRSSSKTRC